MRVLIAMSETGGGHRSVAQAVAAGLHASDASVDVRIVDLFAQGRPSLVDRVTRLYSPTIRHAPWIYGLVYHLSDHPIRYRVIYSGTRRTALKRTVRVLTREQPDVIVSVHPLVNRLLVEARAKVGIDAPIVAVVTELVSVHTSWIEPEIDLYATATPETYEAVLARGVPPERVRLLGLPVGEQFGSVSASPTAIRRGLNLDPTRFTALLIGGGEGVGLRPIVETVARQGLNGQLMVICGRNERLRRRLESADFDIPMRVFGFVTNVAELMHAADVVVTKGGPQTIAEALASGRPVVVTHELPGQEEGNGEFVERHGVGCAAFTPERVAAALQQLSAESSLRQRLAENARAISRPHAAIETGRAIVDVVRAGVHSG